MNTSHFTISENVITFLRGYFSKAENILVESLQDNLWNAVPEKSNIKIEPATKLSEDSVESSPALIVGRGQLSPTVIGMYGGLDRLDYGVGDPLADNGEVRSAEIAGSISVSCVGRSGVESDLLGHEVFFTLLDHGHYLQQDINVGKFEVSALTPAKKVTDSEHLWVCQIDINVSYTHKWSLTQAQPTWKTSKFDLFHSGD